MRGRVVKPRNTWRAQPNRAGARTKEALQAVRAARGVFPEGAAQPGGGSHQRGAAGRPRRPRRIPRGRSPTGRGLAPKRRCRPSAPPAAYSQRAQPNRAGARTKEALQAVRAARGVFPEGAVACRRGLPGLGGWQAPRAGCPAGRLPRPNRNGRACRRGQATRAVDACIHHNHRNTTAAYTGGQATRAVDACIPGAASLGGGD